MRMRRKPWARPELAACPYYIRNGEPYKGKWRDAFGNNNPIYIELGCGKGGFAAELALQNPRINIIAVDIKSEMLALARRTVEKKFNDAGRDIDNVILLTQEIALISNIFSAEDRIERIYINFCNPWYKERHKKHRLTHPRKLAQYGEFLCGGGEIRFKTDDDALFGDSIKYFEQSGFKIIYITQDLHNSDYERNIVTEHEKMFIEKGKGIKFLIAVKQSVKNGK